MTSNNTHFLRRTEDAWTDQASDFNTTMFWAACCTAFFGFFRMGEITAQSVQDNSNRCIQLKGVDHTNLTSIGLYISEAQKLINWAKVWTCFWEKRMRIWSIWLIIYSISVLAIMSRDSRSYKCSYRMMDHTHEEHKLSMSKRL